ncbi:MAG: zinc finger domain-containing protein [Candidatus Binatia bacterium]
MDESLWRARINPARAVGALSKADLARLHARPAPCCGRRFGSDACRNPPAWLTGARRRGGCCPRCRTELRRGRVADRTTYWCPSCQKRL